MKKNIKNAINEINKLSSKYPKNINEALNFNRLENEGEDMINDTPDDLPTHDDIDVPHVEDEIGGAAQKAKKLIDDIRKMSLKAMASLADTPQSPEYENLKRIWQLCDKAVNEKEEQKEIMNKQNGL